MFYRKIKLTLKGRGVILGVMMPAFFQFMGFIMIDGIIPTFDSIKDLTPE
jgi:hypothetical protein